jgi:hypothetical protein
LDLEEGYLEEAVETAFVQARHRPLDDYVDLFLFVGGLHLEFTHHKCLLLLEVVSLLCLL